eukprot:scaffold1649_cov134-Isochrysis_galbana.AAC.3
MNDACSVKVFAFRVGADDEDEGPDSHSNTHRFQGQARLAHTFAHARARPACVCFKWHALGVMRARGLARSHLVTGTTPRRCSAGASYDLILDGAHCGANR